MGTLIFFGVRSPLIVDMEETAARLDVEDFVGVSTASPSRMLARDRVMSIEDARKDGLSGDFICCAFNPDRRAELSDQARELGLNPSAALVDPTAIVARSTRFGALTYVNAGAVIGGAALIGAQVLINRTASIGHHCFIGDGASIAPGVTLASNVRVGRGAVVGVGATVLPDVVIGDGAVVSGGSVVRRNVPDGAFVSGVPATEQRFIKAHSVLSRMDQE